MRRWRRRRWTVLALICGGIILTALLLYSVRMPSEQELIKAYQVLDQKDFVAQNNVADREQSEALAAEVYTGRQLDEALEYLARMREKNIRLEIEKTDYGETRVLEQERDRAVLRVTSRTVGGFYSAIPGQEDKLIKPVDITATYEVLLLKVDHDWRIAEISRLEES